jgi:hypothetical protein
MASKTKQNMMMASYKQKNDDGISKFDDGLKIKNRDAIKVVEAIIITVVEAIIITVFCV